MAEYQTNSKKLLLIYSVIMIVIGLAVGYFIGKASGKKACTTGSSVQTTYGTVCKTCKEIRSCDEAKALLRQGCKDLDRDGDGIPCESLCKR